MPSLAFPDEKRLKVGLRKGGDTVQRLEKHPFPRVCGQRRHAGGINGVAAHSLHGDEKKILPAGFHGGRFKPDVHRPSRDKSNRQKGMHHRMKHLGYLQPLNKAEIRQVAG